MEHFGFILASYLVTIAIIGVVCVWLFLDHRAQMKALGALEARGVRRRSSTPGTAESDAKVGGK